MKAARRALMSSDAWLKTLGAGTGEEDWPGRVLDAERRDADAAAHVVELSGEPGDVVVGHPWLLHTPAPNRGDRPRFMRVQRIRAVR